MTEAIIIAKFPKTETIATKPSIIPCEPAGFVPFRGPNFARAQSANTATQSAGIGPKAPKTNADPEQIRR